MLFKKKKQSLKDFAGTAEGRELTAEELKQIVGGNDIMNQLQDRNGKRLNIEDTEDVTVSYVAGGKTYTTTYSAKNPVFAEMASQEFVSGQKTDAQKPEESTEQKPLQVYTTDTGAAMVFTAKTTGAATEISSVMTGVSEKNGAAKAEADRIMEELVSRVPAHVPPVNTAEIQHPTEEPPVKNAASPGRSDRIAQTIGDMQPAMNIDSGNSAENGTQTPADILENLRRLAGDPPQTSQKPLPTENIHLSTPES